MSVLKAMLKYVGYYILVMALLSVFAGESVRELLITLCGAALSVSMFATIIHLLIGGSIGVAAQKVSAWCLRGTIITASIVIIANIGLLNITRVFTGG